PFTTFHHVLDQEMKLRISLELYLKRMLVGGVERVYELGRVFRNEGIDATHNPEFTMLEAYQAYGDYGSMMDLTEAIVVNAARAVKDSVPARRDGIQDTGGNNQRLVLPWGDATIDLTPPWPRRTYPD